MGEIFFRGKRIDNEEWVYSSFIMQDKEHKVLSAEVELFDGEKWRAVIPETVGQFTGLTDKNGKKIFEGDIVRYRPECWCGLMQSVVEYCADKWNYPAFDLKDHDYEANGLQCAHEEGCCEVIGNIHDNPELLEVMR